MKRKKKKASRIFSFILAMMFLTTAFFSNLVDAKERNLSDNSSVDKQERIQLAQKLGLEKWIDSDGYLSEDYYKDKTDLELSEMGVAPLIHTIDLNSEVMTLSVTKYQKVSYGNTIVGYFEVDGYPSLCCEHDRGTPEAGSSTGSWEEITDANLRTVMYYGYTGPGNIFSDYNKGCVGTSLALVQYVENGRVVTIEGNTSDAVHSRSYALNSSYVTGYCNPEYPAGTTIEIPEGMGTTHTYMGWRTITSRTSLQYQLREQSGEHYDSEGFGIIDGRYVIACTTLYGQVGDYVDFYRENGDVLHCVIGDIKNQNDPGCNQYGHQNGERVVEFVVQYSTWYPSHANPGTPSCKPEWNSRVVKAVNLGYNYFH